MKSSKTFARKNIHGQKPDLTLVRETPSLSTQPPRQLGEHGQKLWSAVMTEYDVGDIGGREILAQAAQALDRAEELAGCIARDGVVIRSKAGIRENPLIKHELACRAFVTRAIARLGLDVEAVRGVGRPAGYSR